MPLNGHSYLVGQGWEGQGKGLRQNAICRPLAIPQKRTLAGLGKDRDEAFPFWDHLFTAAAKTITVKLHRDEDSSGSSDMEDAIPQPTLTRTSTGLISNKRPLLGTPASSGTTTPIASSSGTQTPRMSLITVAKRESARKGLYARFFRGPILGPEILDVLEPNATSTSPFSISLSAASPDATTSILANEAVAPSPSHKETGKRRKDRAASEAHSSTSSTKEQRQRRKEEKRLRKEEKRLRKAKGKEKEAAGDIVRNEDNRDDTPDSRHKKKRKGEEDAETCHERAEEAGRKRKRRKGRDSQDLFSDIVTTELSRQKKKKKEGRKRSKQEI